MAQHGKQMRVGACKGFAYPSVRLVSLANGNRYEDETNTFSFEVVKPSIHLKHCTDPTLTYLTHNCVSNCSLNTRATNSSTFLNRYCEKFDDLVHLSSCADEQFTFVWSWKHTKWEYNSQIQSVSSQQRLIRENVIWNNVTVGCCWGRCGLVVKPAESRAGNANPFLHLHRIR
jgi:hypothetical protein